MQNHFARWTFLDRAWGHRIMVNKLIDPGLESPKNQYTDPSQLGGNLDAGGGPDIARIGPCREQEQDHPRTAYDVNEAHRQLVGWTDDELKQIPLLPVCTRLEPGATYVDLRDPARREFAATDEMQVPLDGLYVPKSEVDHRTWIRLLGIRTAERIGLA
jgi:hypothetical protein